MNFRDFALWLHLLAVVVWVGGMFSWLIVLLTWNPSSERGEEVLWIETLGRRFYVVGWEALGLIVLTGIFNLLVPARTGALFQPFYLHPLLTKLGLIAGMVVLQLWQHFGLLPRLKSVRAKGESGANWRWYLLVTSGLVLVLAAGVLWFGVQLHHM